MKLFWQLGILLICPLLSNQHAITSSPTYIAAVVEYSPVYSAEGNASAADVNVKNYIRIIQKAAEYSVDILVFPESSLSISKSKNVTVSRSEAASYIPSAESQIVPCDDKDNEYAYSFKNISCAAREHKMYIVINHREKVDCKDADCPNDGLLIYNTNVVFDRNGQVIAKYRKVNLFFETGTNVTEKPDLTTFTTDFGVTFGTFICFDVLFKTPPLDLIRDFKITDIVYSAHWFSELPYGYGIEIQAAWAYANDVNFLMAGHNNPKTGSGGSGIFIGRKGYIEVVSEDKASNILIVAEIPKFINGKRSSNITDETTHIYKFDESEIPTSEKTGSGKYTYRTSDLSPYTTKLIDNTSLINATLCNHDLCCDFNLNIIFDHSKIKSDSKYYRYRLAVFNGTMSFAGAASGGSEICAIISCLNDTLDSCGKVFDLNDKIVAPLTFEHINITIKNNTNENTFFMPVTFSSNMKPLNATDFSFESIDSKNVSLHSIRLTQPRDDLITFAVIGRNFVLDGSEVTEDNSPGSSAINLSSPIFVTILFFASMKRKFCDCKKNF